MGIRLFILVLSRVRNVTSTFDFVSSYAQRRVELANKLGTSVFVDSKSQEYQNDQFLTSLVNNFDTQVLYAINKGISIKIKFFTEILDSDVTLLRLVIITKHNSYQGYIPNPKNG